MTSASRVPNLRSLGISLEQLSKVQSVDQRDAPGMSVSAFANCGRAVAHVRSIGSTAEMARLVKPITSGPAAAAALFGIDDIRESVPVEESWTPFKPSS
jgi:hypothetical protein